MQNRVYIELKDLKIGLKKESERENVYLIIRIQIRIWIYKFSPNINYSYITEDFINI